ncbi:MAG: hypothetical protein Q7K03_06975 [Dehalococcoidia bacterium]|nr:hypothetical protein [Dehalococcoidia bacterium]
MLITVKTYPTPAWKGGEVVCAAGITSAGEWIRLFPIPYRLLDDPSKFSKYQWIEARVKKAESDIRPESYNVDIDSIRVVEEVRPDKGWATRKSLISHLMAKSMCQLRADRDANGFPTLGIVHPGSIERLRIEPTQEEWTTADLARMAQLRFIDNGTRQPLQKIPYTFYYDYRCDDPDCGGHKMSCTDWEMSESYRQWSRKYRDKWESAFRNKYEREMKEKNDTHFYVGTVHGHPNNWVIVGLWYPRRLP